MSLPEHTLTVYDHPEPHSHRWSELELEAIKRYAEAYALQAVPAAVDPGRFTHGHNGDSITIYMDRQPVHWVPVLRREPMTPDRIKALVLEADAVNVETGLQAMTWIVRAVEAHHHINRKEQG